MCSVHVRKLLHPPLVVAVRTPKRTDCRTTDERSLESTTGSISRSMLTRDSLTAASAGRGGHFADHSSTVTSNPSTATVHCFPTRVSHCRLRLESLTANLRCTMSMDGCSDSRKRSASTALQTSAVRFPPACLSDFVIHYRGTAYHVHKFVLHYRSSYFRAYIDPLVAGQRACAADECDDHPSIAHCIRLPDSCGKVEADCDDFRLFLCHLYLRSALRLHTVQGRRRR